jgi:hypothetical protein
MDSAILSATSALVGSLIGGVSTFVGLWFSTRGQLRHQRLTHEASKRETLYAEFIIEASKRVTEAWGHSAAGPEVIAGLYSAVERMRLSSSPEVVEVALHVVRGVIEVYASPNRTFDDARARLEAGDEAQIVPLKEFSEVCRAELAGLRG